MPFKHSLTVSEGKYIAICEGDDFWIDNTKLQTQINILESMKEYNFIFSKAISLFENGSASYFCDLGNKKKIIDFGDCIVSPKSTFFPTASFFRKKITKELPSWLYSEAPLGDYFIQLYATREQGAIYLPIATSVYRREVLKSFSVDMKDRNKLDSMNFKYINCILKSNKYLDKNYNKYVRIRLKEYSIRSIFNSSNSVLSKFKLFGLVCIKHSLMIFHYSKRVIEFYFLQLIKSP